MWHLSTILTLLCLLFSSLTSSFTFEISHNSQVSINDDETFTVPGKNPLNFCADPRDYILAIDHVDLTPNPPEA